MITLLCPWPTGGIQWFSMTFRNNSHFLLLSRIRGNHVNVCKCAFVSWHNLGSKSRDTKTRTDIKNLLRSKVRYCSVVLETVVICQLILKMAEEIDFENWRIYNFKGLVTLTLDRVIRHTVVHHWSTSTYIPNLIRIGKTFCGRTDGRTYGTSDPCY